MFPQGKPPQAGLITFLIQDKFKYCYYRVQKGHRNVLMNYLVLFLFFFTAHISASAPFGLKWGDSISTYSVGKRTPEYKQVKVTSLPQNHSKAAVYYLREIPSKGIQNVTMRTDVFDIHSSVRDELFNDFKDSLIKSGYRTIEHNEGTLSSYKCLIQSLCNGESWSGIDKLDDIVYLKIKSIDKKFGYISIQIKSSIFLKYIATKNKKNRVNSEKIKKQDTLSFTSNLSPQGEIENVY